LKFYPKAFRPKLTHKVDCRIAGVDWLAMDMPILTELSIQSKKEILTLNAFKVFFTAFPSLVKLQIRFKKMADFREEVAP
jgi:hypothetical protein